MHTRAVAAASAAAVCCALGLGAAAAPASAEASDPGKPDHASSGQGNPDPGKPEHASSGQGNPDPGKPEHASSGQGNPDPGKPEHASSGQGNPDPGNSDHANSGQGHGHGHGQGGAGGAGDPAGNNGTVKITPVGADDGIPQNSPHPGCSFQIEWYGFDEGPDVVSTVDFAMQAPTRDVALGVDGPATVFVGEDPATGAGTPTGLDGTQIYTLSFDGPAHAQQGYHVKLTVSTPRSNGNDTKTKVFWVAPCDESAVAGDTAGDAADETGATDEGRDTDVASENGVAGISGAPEAADLADTAPSDSGVLGTELAPGVAQDDQGVPTSIEAGSGSHSVISAATSPVGLLVILLGISVGVGAVALRRRRVV